MRENLSGKEFLNMKRIWRKNFEIKRTDYQLGVEVAEEFYHTQKTLGVPYFIKEYIWVVKDMDNVGTYFLVDQLRGLVEAVLEKVKNDPVAIDRLHKKAIALNKEYFAYAKKVKSFDLRKFSACQLVATYEKLLEWQGVSHSHALTTTWFLDCDDQDFSKFLLKWVEKRAKELGVKIEPAAAFVLLTTPLKDSFGRLEEKELLGIVKKIRADKMARQIFTQGTETAKKEFDNLRENLQAQIFSHYQKWRWTPYNYVGPAYELEYYLEVISGLIRQKINPEKLLREYAQTHTKTKQAQNKVFKKLKIDKKHQHYFKISQDIVFIKGFRKDCMYHGMYVLDMILKEVGRRLGLSLIQAKYFAAKELQPALLEKKYNADELNERIKFSVIYMKNAKYQILTGERAKKFLKKQKFEKVKISNIKELRGMVAFPGKVCGVARIVNLAEEIGKIETGEIMLAHTTFPALVPAMKKASAIVTEDGGITCHAAIVARELKKPCVVGVKNLLHFIKDGDKISIDAEKGIVVQVS